MESYRIVLLVVDDVEVAIDLMIALEDAGHRVDHVFRVEDAMLRARAGRPDALVVAAPRFDRQLVQDWPALHPRTALLLVSPSDESRAAAAAAGIPVVERPIVPAVVVDSTVAEIGRLRACAPRPSQPGAPASARGTPASARASRPSEPARSGTQPRTLRALVVARRAIAALLSPDDLGVELAAECVIAPDVRTAIALLAEERFDAVLLDGEILRDPAAGGVLYHRVRALGLPFAPVELTARVDACLAALRDGAARLSRRAPSGSAQG